MIRIAIIGAGLSGLVLAQALAPKAKIQVFEKARGVGGRMSTRFAEPFYFDHGTQCFTARLPEFKDFLKPYLEAGIVAEWNGRIINLEIGKNETERPWLEPHLVASPHMNSLCKALADGINIRKSCEIAPLLEQSAQGWHLLDIHGRNQGEFDWVISTAPPAQTIRLFEHHLMDKHPWRDSVMQGAYALMMGFKHPWDRPWIAAKVRSNPINWISVNSSKPGRNTEHSTLVAHSRNDWAEAHLDENTEDLQAVLMNEFKLITGIDGKNADHTALHRWRYAIVAKTGKTGSYFDPHRKLAATSDWCETSRIEEVWFHANQLAEAFVI